LSGLGANLLSMSAALHACERTGRTLVVDWTGMAHLRDPRTNYFTAFFEPIRHWRGVDVLYVNDPDAGALSFVYDPGTVARPEGSRYPDLLAGRLADPLVLLETYHYRLFDHSGLSRAAIVHETRAFFERLVPRPAVRERMASLAHLFDRRIVIALHVRSGNGEFAAGGPYHKRVNTDIFENDAFLKRVHTACADCVRGFPESVRSEWGIYVATDSAEMQERLLRMPGAFATRERFPPPGAGHQFADFDSSVYGGYTDVDAGVETIVDMFLMARCHGMVCNESAFNWYAQYVTMFFCGNVRSLERYFEHPIKSVGRAALQTARGRGNPFWR
jgi:hypothetical protein